MEARKGIATWLDKLAANYGKKITEQAEYYARLTDIAEDVKIRMGGPKDILLKEETTVYLPEERRKVAFQQEVDVTEIDVPKLFALLNSVERIDDFLSVCSVSQTALEKIQDGAELVERFRINTGKTRAASISVKDMTKTELKEWVKE